ncbi:hypothetical protein ACFFMN_23305 [Planobispora siamensis]|uniref:Uncharacterized protein n=1 Tax=Planobispora siamensis TaxID=936338 RepID=A0A8J3SMS6_9ACTN|nr:hypothetical protein [Planobispora siamensis]GIH95290.1 hypothetical protein Psi01_59200 [Planobispora siamensis]
MFTTCYACIGSGITPGTDQRCTDCRGTRTRLTPGQWVRAYDATAVPTDVLPLARRRRIRWPWLARSGDALLHGVYLRPAPDEAFGGPGQVDYAAFWNGAMVWQWRGPAMPRHSPSPITYWNPLHAQGLSRGWEMLPVAPVSTGVDPDDWSRTAVLKGWKPYAYFNIHRNDVATYLRDAAQRGVTVQVCSRRRRTYAFAATTRPYHALCDLDALIADYADVLPPAWAQEQADAINAVRDLSPATFLGEDGFEQLEECAPAVVALTLGYPAEVTAGMLLARFARTRPVAAELGSLPSSWWRGLI